MSGGLPNQFPQQSVPIGSTAKGESIFLDINWFLLFYNLWLNVLGTSSGGSTPAAPSDFLSLVNLSAQTADTQQIARAIGNLAAQLPMLTQPDGADISRLRHDLANAFALASVPEMPPSVPFAQPAQTVTVTASPFTYTALFNGTLAVSGGTVSAIAIIRQGVTVATGVTAGLIPLRRLDQARITYTAAPTVAFLPS
jgi:hypothetical protein